ncbi:MAG TPA: glycosyltransferase family 39 protein [Planctomycetota bacterium]|nr:glycosyltransferase family 39 protein [Planctomycetota bacterium]
MGSRAAARAGLVLLCIVGVAARWTGTGFLLPEWPCPDDDVVRQVVAFRDGVPESEAPLVYRRYPHLLARTTVCLPDPRAGAAPGENDLGAHLARASATHLQARDLFALLSAAIVPATYALASAFVGPGAALFAAALSATSLLHVWFSQQARPHGPASALALVAVVACMRLRRRPDPLAYLVAGAACGLAIGCFQSGVVTLVPLAAAHLLRDKKNAIREWAFLAAALAIVAALLLWLWPFLVAPQAASAALEGGGAMAGHNFSFRILDGRGLVRSLTSLWTFEPFALALALAGAAIGASAFPRVRKRDVVVPASYAISYLGAIGAYAWSQDRFLLPLVPYVACLAAYALARTYARGGWAARAAAVAGAIALAVPAAATAKLVWLRSQPGADTLSLAGKWIAEHVAPERERVLLVPSLDVPLFKSRAAIEANRARGIGPRGPGDSPAWNSYLESEPPPRWSGPVFDLRWIAFATTTEARAFLLGDDADGWLRSLGGDFALIEVLQFGETGMQHALRESMRRVGTRVARFGPTDQDPPVNLSYQDNGNAPEGGVGGVCWPLQVLRSERVGPVVEIYRLGP